MKSIEIIGFKRANLGKKYVADLRANALVPCVVYGNGEVIHFQSHMRLFRELIYTNEAYFVTLNIEGNIKKCILQDIQFHPVSEIILHADFYELKEDKPIKMDIPVKVNGTAVGVQKGGKLILKMNKLKIKAIPHKMPDNIPIDVTDLDLGKNIKVFNITTVDYTILNNRQSTIITIPITRATKETEEQANKPVSSTSASSTATKPSPASPAKVSPTKTPPKKS
ncbi:MAG: 50S ribosomal protein L25/general stress protein Ctc [Chitinophagaceae bacterium]|nr:50S ribosomal protein L25/general stress protein Ctc [Chitinophagaceae bacterium]